MRTLPRAIAAVGCALGLVLAAGIPPAHAEVVDTDGFIIDGSRVDIGQLPYANHHPLGSATVRWGDGVDHHWVHVTGRMFVRWPRSGGCAWYSVYFIGAGYGESVGSCAPGIDFPPTLSIGRWSDDESVTSVRVCGWFVHHSGRLVDRHCVTRDRRDDFTTGSGGLGAGFSLSGRSAGRR